MRAALPLLFFGLQRVFVFIYTYRGSSAGKTPSERAKSSGSSQAACQLLTCDDYKRVCALGRACLFLWRFC